MAAFTRDGQAYRPPVGCPDTGQPWAVSLCVVGGSPWTAADHAAGPSCTHSKDAAVTAV